MRSNFHHCDWLPTMFIHNALEDSILAVTPIRVNLYFKCVAKRWHTASRIKPTHDPNCTGRTSCVRLALQMREFPECAPANCQNDSTWKTFEHTLGLAHCEEDILPVAYDYLYERLENCSRVELFGFRNSIFLVIFLVCVGEEDLLLPLLIVYLPCYPSFLGSSPTLLLS